MAFYVNCYFCYWNFTLGLGYCNILVSLLLLFWRGPFLLLINYSCPNFPPVALPHATQPPAPLVSTHPIVLVPGSFIHVPWWPFPFFPLLSPSPFPLVTVSVFLISICLVLFCSLVCFVHWTPHISEIIWYLPFITWLISLSIMLSSSIHAVAQGQSSFFLSAV